MWLHRDASMVPSFPRKLSGSANTGRRLLADAGRPRRGQQERAGGRRQATGSSTPSGPTARSCRAGRCTRIRCRCTGERAFDTVTSLRRRWGGRLPRSPRTTWITTASRRSSPPTCRGRSMAGGRTAIGSSTSSRIPTTPASRWRPSTRATASSADAARLHSAHRCSPTSTVMAPGGHRRFDGPPRLRLAHERRPGGRLPRAGGRPEQGPVDRPPTHQVTFNANAGSGNRARSSIPRLWAIWTARRAALTPCRRSCLGPTRSTRRIPTAAPTPT